MRDDRHRWDVVDLDASKIEARGLLITAIDVGSQCLVSGPKVLRQKAPTVKWPDVADGDTYTLSLRRDRVMCVGEPALADGWDDKKNQAVSDVGDAYVVFQLSGPNAIALLKRGTELRLDQPSKSVARMLFGLGLFLYRHGDEETYRLHVARAHGTAMWKSLRDHAAAVE